MVVLRLTRKKKQNKAIEQAKKGGASAPESRGTSTATSRASSVDTKTTSKAATTKSKKK